MTTLDVGYMTYSIETSTFVYGFASLIDYDPASSARDDAIGEHYKLFQADDGAYLLAYRVRGQRAFGAPGFTVTEGFFPIPSDVALLLIGRSRDPVGEGAGQYQTVGCVVGKPNIEMSEGYSVSKSDFASSDCRTILASVPRRSES
jgi:hypothetical protein